MNAASFLTLSGASFRAGERVVFRQTDWSFRRDEQWAVVGRNGSGKSLLAAALQGALPVVEGNVDYHFRTRAGESPEQRVACVSFEQQRGLATGGLAAARWFSLEQEESAVVRDVLTFDAVEEINPFAVADFSRERGVFASRLKRVVRDLVIAPLLERRLVQLSNGEMRKVLIARALLKEPRLLILDDPMAGLDSVYRAHFQEMIARLARRREMRLLVMVVRADDLPKAITHVALVEGCRVVAQGRRAAMLRDPRVAASLAAPRVRAKRGVKKVAVGRELVRMRNVCLSFGRRAVLRDVSWTVCEGESWAVVGRNGAGKSALLAMIAGNLSPTSASEFSLFGRARGSGESRAWIRRHLGEVSPELLMHFEVQQSVLDAVLTGFADSALLMARPSSARRREAMRWLHRFGLRRAAHESLASLSSGSQRLALLARALVKRPALLLLDEPCQGLDGGNRQLFLDAVQALVARGALTVLYTTHRADEIPPAIERVLTIREGRAFLGSRRRGTRA